MRTELFRALPIMKRLLASCAFVLCALSASARYTRQDTLRGSNGPGRIWWDVLRYDLSVDLDSATSSLKGRNVMRFLVLSNPAGSMQIDLQDSMLLDEVKWAGRQLRFTREGNVYWITHPFDSKVVGSTEELELIFHGKPRKAVMPPWDGGVIWTKDSRGKPWLAVACQGLGASSWWPCKDQQADEPDSGMSITLSTLKGLQSISNGRMQPFDPTSKAFRNGLADAIRWEVRNPINTYNASFYIGDYAHWQDTFRGENGILDLDFYPLKHNEAKARTHWAVTKEMLRCFEYWLGPYPFYEDGYKLVEAPYLGMEHQSAVAYGNEYKMGYRGRDLTETGLGLSFDFIIIHESGHEWFANNITASDMADDWLHEGITCYTEVLFVEWIKGRDSAFKYARGQWSAAKAIGTPIGDYGVNYKITSVMYNRGSVVMHMIRMMMHDDQKFRQLLRELNKDFYHKIVSSRQVEDSISRFTGMDLKLFFNHYLRKSNLPAVVASQHGTKITLSMPYKDVDDAFSLPIYNGNGRFICDLSRKPVTIPAEDVSALLNYLIAYSLKD